MKGQRGGFVSTGPRHRGRHKPIAYFSFQLSAIEEVVRHRVGFVEEGLTACPAPLVDLRTRAAIGL